LRGSRIVAVGSLVDATKGRVRLTTAINRRGRTQSGVFYEGAFVVSQSRRSALTELRLAGHLSCPSGAGARTARKARSRRLWGRAKGRFRTTGRFSAATVRGTTWLTQDSCRATTTRASSGTVEVTAEGDLPLKVSIPTGDQASLFCTAKGPDVAPRYCLFVYNNGRDGSAAAGVVAQARPDIPDYQLCVSGAGQRQCITRPLQATGTAGSPYPVRADYISCYASIAAIYTASWQVAAVPLGQLSTAPVPARPPARCVGLPPGALTGKTGT
jgi:hypothetical protein